MTELLGELQSCIRARCSVIHIRTIEEERVARIVAAAGTACGYAVSAWDLPLGFQVLAGNGLTGSVDEPAKALDAIEGAPDATVAVLLGFSDWLNEPWAKRKILTLAAAFRYVRKSIVIVSNERLPPDLLDIAVELALPLPGASEFAAALDELRQTPRANITSSEDEVRSLTAAAAGLTLNQARRSFARALIAEGRLDAASTGRIIADKQQVLASSDTLELLADPPAPDAIGGLGHLKHWLTLRGKAFTPAAREYGLPSPKGIALIGIPGTGKSLTAKAIGAMWGLPVIRYDVAASYGKYIGESESRTRQALSIAEAVAPCVLWMDEIDKAFATGDSDGGTAKRVFGSILTWMQEKEAAVFVVATANNIDALPPETLRRGRFDEVFFLDLPTAEERAAILRVHLAKYGRPEIETSIDALVEASAGMVGAEVEQSVIDALYVAFAEDREPEGRDVVSAMKRLVPLSVAQKDAVERMRAWMLDGRAQSASFTRSEDARTAFVPLDLL